jgi:hypothetical protein
MYKDVGLLMFTQVKSFTVQSPGHSKTVKSFAIVLMADYQGGFIDHPQLGHQIVMILF